MDSDKLNRLKIKLSEQLKILSSQDIDFNVDSDGDEYDEIQANAILDFAYITKERNRKKIENILYALQKIKDNEFGFCEDCGEDIEEKRMEIFPDAKYCVKCAELIEKNNRGFCR